MRSPNRIRSRASKLVYLVVSLVFILHLVTVPAMATPSLPTISMDRYDSIPVPAVISSTTTSGAITSEPDVTDDSAHKDKEEIDLKEFNGTFLDTVIYIIGGLSGFMMILQIAFYCLCKVFPSLNEKLGRLKFMGITGYDDSLAVFCIKTIVMGVLSYLCLSGIIKRGIGWLIGYFANYFHIGG